jgi:hypothetical protein
MAKQLLPKARPYSEFSWNEMARSSECTDQYARKVLDTADIVIALGKSGRGEPKMKR